MTNQKLYKELQGMMPDYIFDNLTSEQKHYFEENYTNFPDLIEEVNEARGVFDRFDKMEFDRKIAAKTRNLSVKVNQRRQLEMTERQKRTRFFMRYLAPSMSLAIVAFLMFTPMGKKFMMPNVAKIDSIATEQHLTEPIEFVQYSDLLAISDSGNLEPFYEAVTESETIVENEDESLTEYLENAFAAAIAETNTNVLLNSVGNYSAIEDDLSMLSENEFQSIIEDLENEIDF
jgi:hypothetical protein